MNSPKLNRLATGRFGHLAAVVALSGGMLAGTAGAALASVGTMPGTVNLNPTTGPTSSTPTWSTTVGCNPGFQGSAVFREVHSDGVTTDNISPPVNGAAAPFSGTLLATMAQIQSAGGIVNGGTQELVVVCFSGPNLTGTSDPEMDTFVTYSGDGSAYTTSLPSSGAPVGEVGGIALAGLAAIGLGWTQFRRIRSRRAQPSTSAA